MALALVKRTTMVKGLVQETCRRAFTKLAMGADLLSAAPNVSLQKACSWEEGLSSNFATIPLQDIFKGKKVVIFGLPNTDTGVISAQQVPSYKNNIDKFKAKGFDSVICVAFNDPYKLNDWAEKLQAKEAIEFYGDFDGSFHKSLDLTIDLSRALLAPTYLSDLPFEIQHPCHSNHPLMLRQPDNYWRKEELIECRICGDHVNVKEGDLFYECETCRPKFQIDIVCAVLVRRGFKVEHRSHPQHPLLPMGEKALFLCQGCGVKHYDSPLMCNLCEFWIARSCAQLPSTFEAEDHHEHLLQLKYSSHNKSGGSNTTSDLDHDHQGDRVACGICAKPINHRFWVYECGGRCRYVAHVQCAKSGTEAFMSVLHPARSHLVDFKKTIRLPVEDVSISFIPYITKGIHQDIEGPPGPNWILHNAMPTNDGSSNHQERKKNSNWSLLCNLCIQPISPPFYSSRDAKCSFLMHAECLYMPVTRVRFGERELDNRYNIGDSPYFFNVFYCDACKRRSNGFRYSDNAVKLDMKCAFTPRFIIHESHPKHRLILDKRRYAPCLCCLLAGEDQGEYIYRCETCSFNLHIKCASYPSIVHHRYDKHPLKLTYKPHISEEYYCEICEDEVNIQGWFYYCAECNQAFHITCIPQLDHLSNIKFGGILKLSYHAHQLTLERIIVDQPCKYCNEVIDSRSEGMAFQCKECIRYQIHFHCAKSLYGKEHDGDDSWEYEAAMKSLNTGNPFSTGGEELE